MLKGMRMRRSAMLRQSVLLHIEAGWDPADVADVLNLTIRTVQKYLHAHRRGPGLIPRAAEVRADCERFRSELESAR
jgi:hypothetical protein